MKTIPKEEAIPAKSLRVLNQRIIECRLCPRLVRYRENVAREKRRAFRECNYWGRPLPGFGDPHAKLLIVGLAPAAHGGNRTGRVFTGDRSGDFLFRLLYQAGFASQPQSTGRDDGMVLRDAYICAAVRCAPPANKPLPGEMKNCLPYFERELELIQPRAVLALGAIAFRACLTVLKERGVVKRFAAYHFAHAAAYDIGPSAPQLFASYHPSQQNTFTGKLTEKMFLRVLHQIRELLAVK
jgi:uracil-DNA glycosylase family 4